MFGEKLKEIREYWFPNDKSSGPHKSVNAAFDRIGFDERYVDKAISTRSRVKSTKFIKDNIWGMIELDRSSIILLDCPVLQRLRGIKQLGFTYLTYPTADHSRFAHSLGMYAVVQKFMDAMALQARVEAGAGYERYDIQADDKLDFLHAALLHDAGHGPFSHVTEQILESLCQSKPLRIGQLALQDCIERTHEVLETHLHLSEILSLVFLLSPRFSNFYFQAVRPNDGDRADAALRLAALIAGRPFRPECPGFADLISSKAVDADKIDYIRRDSTAAGIPAGIDVARLFLRSSFLRIEGELKTRLYARGTDPAPDKAVIVFAVNASGIDTLEELRTARTTLYQRVYLHKTTRTAERLLARAFQSLADLPLFSENGSTLHDPINLWTMDDWSLLQAIRNSLDPTAKALADRLLNRKLLQRAAMFWAPLFEPLSSFDPISNYQPGPSDKDLRRQTVRDAVDQLKHNCDEDPSYVDSLETLIAQEMQRISKSLQTRRYNTSGAEVADPMIAIVPMLPLKTLKLGDTVVLDNNVVEHSSHWTIVDEQSDAAEIYKSRGYIMTDDRCRTIGMIASRTALYLKSREFKPGAVAVDKAAKIRVASQPRLLLNLDETARRSGLDIKEVDAVMRELEKAGHFNEVPRLARPFKETQLAERILARMSQFNGQHGWRVTRASITSFLNQFPPALRDEMARILRDQFIILDRELLRDRLTRSLDAIRYQGGKKYIAALSPNSGNFVRMILEQEAKAVLEEKGWIFASTLREALHLSSKGDLIALCDDVVSSGSQASAQFRAWFGQAIDKWPRDQRREKNIEHNSLGDEAGKLTDVNIAVAVSIAADGAAAAINAAFQENGWSNFIGVFSGSTMEDAGAKPVRLSGQLERFLHDVGAQLLLQGRAASDPAMSQDERDAAEKWCDENALGYSGKRHCVATLFNVPTSTITAMWCPGVYKGDPWCPLLLRRGYFSDVTIA